MANFLDHIPEQHAPALRDAITAVHETKGLLMQVQARFGTQDPAALAVRIGEDCDGVQVTPEAVSELEALLALHEERRLACRALMERITGAAPAEGEIP